MLSGHHLDPKYRTPDVRAMCCTLCEKIGLLLTVSLKPLASITSPGSFLGESSLRRALTQYLDHYHRERNHQGKGNRLLFPLPRRPVKRRGGGAVKCNERLGGLLKYYERRAA